MGCCYHFFRFKIKMYIQRITKKEATSFFQKYEHLGNCGLGVWHYALIHNNQMLSVVSFGSTAFNPYHSFWGDLGKKYNMKVIQLTRGGTRYDAPKNIPSLTISMAIKEIRKSLGDCIIIAYSDTKWNEIGTIYQASNFLYCGLTNPGGQSNYLIKNKIVSGWSVRKAYGTRSMNKLLKIDNTIKKIPLTPKHIYLYIKTSKMKKRLIIKDIEKRYHISELTYPKRIDFNLQSMRCIRNHTH